ncbi:DddA-like double-stranded DNA deaminase toxin [Actinokineospora iranica]|uniref:DddA-like double-stranded DNA deaminase toxin n=1 Tax=Actinokineospora iranica TaxID=1271860 RepID=UPI0011138145|nr:DddA-like double-stranded DNA deaminase toxin [Actinokineospora iranica]
MAIADDVGRLAVLTNQVTRLQGVLVAISEIMLGIDDETARILGDGPRASAINHAIGAAEARLRDLHAVLDLVCDHITRTAEHHLNDRPTSPRPVTATTSTLLYDEKPLTEIELLRSALPPDLVDDQSRPLPRPRGKPAPKTHGRWVDQNGKVREEISGWDEKYDTAVEWFEQQQPPRVPSTAAHVEVKIAVHMRLNRIPAVTLAINNLPCTGDWGCDALVPQVLPCGYTMTIHGSNGFRRVYYGKAT